jgi:hypothetical protein
MADSDDLDEPLPPNGMSARTALLAGLVLGIAMMVGVLGFLAWRNRTTSPTESSEHNQPVAPSRASP